MNNDNKINRRTLIIFTFVGLMCLLLIVALPRIINYIDSPTKEFTTNKIEDYRKWNGHIQKEKEELMNASGLYIFPENSNRNKLLEYKYYCSDYPFAENGYVIYAKMKYSNDEEYDKEEKRLSNISCNINVGDNTKKNKKIIYSKKIFDYPAYVAIYCSNLCYEYALMDYENKEIIYVFIKLKDAKDLISYKYLPKENRGEDMFEDNNWDNTNIYWYNSRKERVYYPYNE